MIKVPEKARSVEIGLINRMTGYIYFDDIRMILEESLQWKKIETKYVTFYYLEECPFPDGAIQREAEMLEGHVKKLGLKTKSKFEYYYYPSVERFQKIMGIKNGNQRADWEDKELHTTAPFEDLEAIHMLLADYGYPPLGLTTGLVYYLRGSLKGRDIHTVAKEFLLQKKIPALYKTLEADAFRKANTSITVPAWTSFCKYLIDLYGTKKFMKFFASMDKIEKAGPFNERFKKVYDEDFDVVDRDWRLYILRYESKEGTDTLQ